MQDEPPPAIVLPTELVAGLEAKAGGSVGNVQEEVQFPLLEPVSTSSPAGIPFI